MGIGNTIGYTFSPTAKPGIRVITASVTNPKGLTAKRSITVDYEPQINSPGVSIVYPPNGATFSAGTIPVRGQARTAVNLGYISCDKLVWQQGIAATPIPSTTYNEAQGLCEAQVSFQAGASPQTLRLTATDVTGKVGTAEEQLTITAASPQTTISIDEPTDNEQYFRWVGQGTEIKLDAFVQNPPSSGALTYTWYWYPATGSSSKNYIGVGQWHHWYTENACNDNIVEVDLTSPSIPASESPKATKHIWVTCSDSD
jgi:hypothetical protein